MLADLRQGHLSEGDPFGLEAERAWLVTPASEHHAKHHGYS